MHLNTLLTQFWTSAVGGDLKEIEENLIGNWKKGDPDYEVEESLATLSPAVMWRAESLPSKLGDLAEDNSSQSGKAPWFLLTACKR